MKENRKHRKEEKKGQSSNNIRIKKLNENFQNKDFTVIMDGRKRRRRRKDGARKNSKMRNIDLLFMFLPRHLMVMQ